MPSKLTCSLPLFILLALCFSASQVTAQAPAEPFRFGEVDLELLSQTEQLDKKFDEQGLVYHDQALAAYVERLGRSLLTPTDDKLEHVTWRFFVFRDPAINAFALPNGSVYVHSGLLAMLDNESQLASVLAHELVHVRHRHTYLGYRSYRKKSLTVNILSGISAYGSGSAAWAVSIAMQYILAISIIGHTREQEREADTLGAQMLLNSAYEPQEMVGALKRLQNDYEVKLEGEPFYGDHPKLKERVAYLSELLGKAADKRTFTADEQAASKDRYFKSVEAITRHNIELSIDAGFYRTAVALARRLVESQSASAANVTALADAYAALGPRPLEPTAEEKTGKGKREARRRRNKLTLQEEYKTLAATPAGQELQKANYAEADKLYRQALELDGKYALAWRGLGELLEKQAQAQAASEAYRKYIEFNPGALDRLLIMRRIKTLEEKAAAPPVAKPQ